MTERFFNNTGPSMASLHYMIDPLVRIDIDELEVLMRARRYFVLHVGRQTGKTTVRLALMAHLNAKGEYQALCCRIENAQIARGDVDSDMRAVCGALSNRAQFFLQETRLRGWLEDIWPEQDPNAALRTLLQRWCAADARP